MDSLIFTSDSAKATIVEETVAANRDSFPTAQSDAQGISQDIANKEEIEAEVEVENVERPVDLYKVLSICSILIIF
jgi:G patch domain-containing protein 1